jgi:chorismate-pyruvate lyase
MVTTPPTPLATRIAALLDPLSVFYRQSGAQLPALREIEGDAMPEPYRTLLVHDNDMTPTLEAHTGGRIHLKLLQVRRSAMTLHREVILMSTGEHPVEFGAIRIHLDRFGPEPRRLITEGCIPLGRILDDFAIAHVNRPNGFFQIASDTVMAEAFEVDTPTMLYGRHNVLADERGRPLAEVVEILPPLPIRPETA